MTRLVLYSNKGCPFAQRSRIALLASGADYETVEVELREKLPPWYAPNINPARKVPAISYGSTPDSSVEKPSEGSFILPESALIVDFVADLFPKITYSDPIKKAQSALLAVQYDALVATNWRAFSSGEASSSALLEGIKSFNAYIPDSFLASAEFGVGEILIAPFLGRFILSATANVGDFSEGDDAGAKLIETLKTSPEYEKFYKLTTKILEWDAFEKSWDSAYILKHTQERLAAAKSAKA